MTKDEIKSGLAALGLKSGDIVLLHSSLSSIGHVEGGADAVIDAFLEVLGPGGTLVVPVFGALGVITERVRSRPEAVKSIHPKAAVAAIGGDAEGICRDHWKAETAHAENTPYTRIAEKGGYVCLLGVDQDRNTTLHTVEELLRLPYLKTTAEITFDTPEGPQTKSWKFFPGPHRDFIGLDRILRESGKMRTGTIGNAVVRLIRAKDLIDVCLQVGRRHPAFVLCDNPNCADCVAQRAAIRRDRFGRETFRLAAASGLAGRYVPEIVDNLHAAGVAGVELDILHGKPIQMLSRDELERAVQELAAADCPVAALRLRAAGDFVARMLDIAESSGVGRVVVPMVSDVVEYATLAAERGITLAFSNLGVSSDAALSVLRDLRERGLPANFAFSPANFASAGEKPFLQSFRRKFARFIDQLDIEDATFDGRSMRLAKGNAEIKELISILRCRSFAGLFVLTTRNRETADLRRTVEDFEHLFDLL